MKNDKEQLNIIRTNKTKEYVLEHPENNYVRIHGETVLDFNLSDGAMRLLFYCLSKPDDFDFYVDRIAIEINRDRKTVRANLNKLIKAGYCHKSIINNEKNHYRFYETPLLNPYLNEEKKSNVPSKDKRKNETNTRKQKYMEQKEKELYKAGKNSPAKNSPAEDNLGGENLPGRRGKVTLQAGRIYPAGGEKFPPNNNSSTNNGVNNNSFTNYWEKKEKEIPMPVQNEESVQDILENNIFQEQEEYIEKLIEKVFQYNKNKCKGNEVLFKFRLENNLPSLVRSFIGQENSIKDIEDKCKSKVPNPIKSALNGLIQGLIHELNN